MTMKNITLVALLLLGCVVLVGASTTFDLTLTDDILFEQFVMKYNKNYETEEERIKRFEIFKENVKRIREKNVERKHEWEATYGINSRSDLTTEELRKLADAE